MEKYREILLGTLNSFTTYDYVGFGLVFFLFILCLILALMLRRRVKTSVFFMLLAFVFLLAGPYSVYVYVHTMLYKAETKVTSIKKLHYTSTLVVKGELSYQGKADSSKCSVYAKVFKTGPETFIKKLAQKIKPYKKRHTDFNKTFTKGDNMPFKILIEPFAYEGDFNVTSYAKCEKQ